MREVRSGDEPPEDFARRMRRRRVPTNEFGGPALMEPELFRSGDRAVQLCSVRVYSVGVRFDLQTVVRDPGTDPWSLHRRGPGRDPDDHLWIGVKLPDGRTATNAGFRFPEDADDDTPVLTRLGGSGDGTTMSLSYLLTPMPPPGPIELVLAWPAGDIAERWITLDGQALADAAARLVVLWPPQPDPSFPGPPRAPTPPPGWFERNPPPADPPRPG
ncbi:hypothetical protein [Nakamurella leprariae]|uniref:Uncharacterized protein n=1 Tax=Nakamurella leprariae TaxID=2803911 RepID=A0A939C0G3_9ACTN|nr:hypothetical protein [Nakamurella leprariae]MBM9465999.1 hypothetical protein [Nakamurella leprariae]